ncbi:MAG: histidine phosphatase family protein [Aquabacterium sp.]|uniref:SixA phosphatase family protein n=1 Tax=Aquabacterium sp. TaxID=1872578 RepID=UPI0025C1B6BA|nr:histidine phosphatase family protein [Aquabacterium sp.]MBI5925198.1 histidine phosphatase family protein [Aquabacterium sp.]
MDLILWRHAQAHALPLDEELQTRAAAGEDLTVHIDLAQDLARTLTPKGERQAERMAHWLNQRLPDTTRVLVSPAQRTQQTAMALGRSYKTVRSIDPQASVDDLLAAARWPRNKDPVLIVGHQPTLGMLAARLLTGQDLAWSVRKGAVWWLRSRERDGETSVTLHAVQTPDFL